MTFENDPPYAIHKSQGFDEWLSKTKGSVLFSTYQAGKIFFVGGADGNASGALELSFPRAMGIGVSANQQQLFLATQHQIYRFDDFLRGEGQDEDGHDALYMPRLSWVTGDLDAHDIVATRSGRPIFVNTFFNCLATVSAGYSFRPIWKPGFITGMVAEDRCHLNGLAADKGSPAYVTAVSTTDVKGGWREARADGGVVIDVRSNAIITRGLSMPHSPRLYRGKLWLLNSGQGAFGYVDVDTGAFHQVAVCPGYARGLSFAGRYAIIGLSLPREGGVFTGLPLDDVLARHGLQPMCGIMVVDTVSGKTVASLKIEGAVRELYDTQFVRGIRNPKAIGYRTDQLRKSISIDDRPAT
ncbi:TIGR03032 family protein [Donghicola mangrovi]|uniref:TIGR03032 family protein n=1 Tax=Donghicola mangrovi TaxID=2729614 RepID=A0A850QF81_9RHOB|nr:TIGR03032 family protein [Donghicola mangrovi]NVO24779.1 TIGR03032 family protein [Donghicola mangrovi]